MLRHRKRDDSFAHDCIFGMPHIVGSAIAHVKSQWQERPLCKQFNEFFWFHMPTDSAIAVLRIVSTRLNARFSFARSFIQLPAQVRMILRPDGFDFYPAIYGKFSRSSRSLGLPLAFLLAFKSSG